MGPKQMNCLSQKRLSLSERISHRDERRQYPPGPDKWVPDGRPEYLKQCVDKSLRRLKLDRIDLYQLHRVDSKVPMEDSLGALKEAQSAGKIRHIGLSEVSPNR